MSQTNVLGVDALKVGLIYKPAKVIRGVTGGEVEDYPGSFSPTGVTLRDLRTVDVLAVGLAALAVLVGGLFFRRR